MICSSHCTDYHKISSGTSWPCGSKSHKNEACLSWTQLQSNGIPTGCKVMGMGGQTSGSAEDSIFTFSRQADKTHDVTSAKTWKPSHDLEQLFQRSISQRQEFGCTPESVATALLDSLHSSCLD